MLNPFLKRELSLPANGINPLALSDWEPISSLPIRHQEEILSKSHTDHFQTGDRLFVIGEKDEKDYYLLSGAVELIDERGKIISEITANDHKKLQLIDHHHPRIFTAKISMRSEVFVTRRTFYDTLNAPSVERHIPQMEVDELDFEASGNWMLHMLNSGAFAHLPPSRLQEVFLHMTPLEVSAGQTLITQGEAHEYFYLLQQGKAIIDHNGAQIATLATGDTFGERTMITQTTSAYSITMETDGALMRMPRSSFESLIASALILPTEITSFDQTIASETLFLDMRSKNAIEANPIDNSLHFIDSDLYKNIDQLNAASSYIVIADSEKEAQVAAFILSANGLNAFFAPTSLNQSLSASSLEKEAGDPPSENVPASAKIKKQPIVDKTQSAVKNAATIESRPAEHPLLDEISNSMQDMELQIRKEMNDLLLLKKRELEQEMEFRFKQYHLITAKLLKKKLSDLQLHRAETD